MFALKLLFASLLTIVLAVLLEVADAISVAIVPEIWLLFIVVAATKLFTYWVVAICVLLVVISAVGAVGVPVNDGDDIVGDTIVLEVNVSVPDKVESVPVVGKVIFVTPVLVNVVL